MKGIVTTELLAPNLGDLIVPVSRPVVKAGDTPQALLWGHIVVVFEGDNAEDAAKWAQYLTSDLDTSVTYFEEMASRPQPKPA